MYFKWRTRKHLGARYPQASRKREEVLTRQVILTPHVGGVTDVSYSTMAQVLVERVRSFFGDEKCGKDTRRWGYSEGIDGCVVAARASLTNQALHPPPIFEPTHEFQTVPEGAILPPGLHIRINMVTGQKEARLA